MSTKLGRSRTWADRQVGVFGPRGASLLLIWLASHRDRLHALLLGGKRLTVVILWDKLGRQKVQKRTPEEIRAMSVVAFGPKNVHKTPAISIAWGTNPFTTMAGAGIIEITREDGKVHMFCGHHEMARELAEFFEVELKEEQND